MRLKSSLALVRRWYAWPRRPRCLVHASLEIQGPSLPRKFGPAAVLKTVVSVVSKYAKRESPKASSEGNPQLCNLGQVTHALSEPQFPSLKRR